MAVFSDLAGLKRGVVIHHWDTDGVVSAAMLRNYFRQHFPAVILELFMPTVTNYYLTDDQYDYLQKQGYEFALTCDLNFPSDVVQRLAQLYPGQVYFFDHHHHPAPHENVHYYNKPHPACASHIAELLDLPYDLLPVIAMVGDREESIQHDPMFYPYVQTVMADANLTFSQLLLIRSLIDSNYIVDDYKGIAETIALVQDDPLSILTEVHLQANLKKIAATITELIARPAQPLSENVSFWDISTPYNILSHVTRHLSRQYPQQIMFTRQLKNQQYTCYIRRREMQFDVRQMISYAHTLGLNAGGKEEVAGIIIPPERIQEVFPKIQSELLRLTQ